MCGVTPHVDLLWLSVPAAAWVTTRHGPRRSNRLRWSDALRSALCEAQNHRCAYCGRRTELVPGHAFHPGSPTLDHVVPLSRGGADHPENLVLACYRCNVVLKVGHGQAETNCLQPRWSALGD